MLLAVAWYFCSEHLGAIGNDNPLTAFWTCYFEVTEITFGVLHAARQRNCLPRLLSSRAMIPLWSAYVKVNYERLLSYCYAITNSSCKVVSVSSLVARIPFGRIHADQTMDVRVNTDIPRQQEAQSASA